MTSERLEAIGPNGEACIILRAEPSQLDSKKQARYTLAAGERLRPVDELNSVFETLDGKRRFRLRHFKARTADSQGRSTEARSPQGGQDYGASH